MKTITPRRIAAVLALGVTAAVLQGIATLAHVDDRSLPVVMLPAVQVVAIKPAQPSVAQHSTTTVGRM
jgi:hypothetical protein